MASFKLRFFNFFRNLIRLLRFDFVLSRLTQGKGYSNFFVKCIPQNYQYRKFTFRNVKRDGVWFRLDLSEYMEWVVYFGLDVEMRRELYPLVRPGMVVMDIGTNFGETLLHFARLAGNGGYVYGFEAVEDSFLKCSRNVALNSFGHIHVEHMALSDVDEILYFKSATNNNSGGISMSKADAAGNRSVRARPLDDYVRESGIRRIDFMKLDVEGFETNILKGGREVCLRFHPELYIEVDDSNLKRQGSSADELLRILDSYGYRINKKVVSPYAVDADSHYDVHAVFDIKS